MDAWSGSDEERWMYELAGARYPGLKPSRMISLGGSGPDDDDDGLADLDRLIEEVNAGSLDEPPAEEDEDRSDHESTGPSEVDPKDDPEEAWIAETLAAPIPDQRWTWDAFQARRRILADKAVIREASRRVCCLSWKTGASPGLIAAGKNFPLLDRALNSSSSRAVVTSNKKKEASSIPTRVGQFQIQNIPAPNVPKLPAWKKLPAANERDPELREVIAGMRFASVACDGSLTVERWLHELPGSEVAFLSFDICAEAAERFLSGEQGAVGVALHRKFLRRLQSVLGDVSMSAIWTRPPDGRPGAVRVFLMLRSKHTGRARDVEELDRSNRYHHSLVRHGVKCSHDGPLRVSDEELAPYIGGRLEQFLEVSGSEGYNLTDEVAIQEFTPECGFATCQEIAMRAAKSHANWNEFTAAHGLPAWLGVDFLRRLYDCMIYSPAHARRRQRMIAKVKRSKYFNCRADKGLVSKLQRMQLMELSRPNTHYYQASPAQFAALAIRSGEVLGEYCDNRHKAGRARKLYEEVRASTRASSTSVLEEL